MGGVFRENYFLFNKHFKKFSFSSISCDKGLFSTFIGWANCCLCLGGLEADEQLITASRKHLRFTLKHDFLVIAERGHTQHAECWSGFSSCIHILK